MLQIIMLSFPSLLVSAGLIAISLKVVLLYSDDYYSWGFAVVFGAIVSCSDPMEVVRLLNDASAPKKFISLVQGESLFNNCNSMIFLLVSVQLARGQYGDWSNVVKYGVSLFIGSILLGIIVGIGTIYWMKRVNNSSALTINVMYVSTYLTYFIAENVNIFFDANGLVSVITLGIYMSVFTRIKVRHESVYSLDVFWQYMTFIVQSLIFMITGLTAGIRLISKEQTFIRTIDYTNLPLLYLCIMGSRFLSILLLMKTIAPWGYGMRLSEIVLLTYSGCRGALQLSMALLVVEEQSFSDQWSDIILFHVVGIVTLTMIINGSTTGLLVNLLRLSRTQAGKQKVLTNFMQEMRDQVDALLITMQEDREARKVDWAKVQYFSGSTELQQRIDNNLEDIEKRYQQEQTQRQKLLPQSLEIKFYKHLSSRAEVQMEPLQNQDLSEELIIEARDTFLMALRQTYWDLHSQNNCSTEAVGLLVQSLRWDLDTVEIRMSSWDFVHNLFYSPLYLRFLYWMKGFPLIGGFAGDLLFDWVGMGYQVISTYVKAHEETELLIQEFPIMHTVMQLITKESQENRKNAERFIAGYLQVSFPEIIKLIQNKKASLGLLYMQKQFATVKQSQGELEHQEYKNLQMQLNDLIGQVEDLHPNWRAQQTYKKLGELPLFKEFSDPLLQELCLDCRELVFDKDQCITREGELARYVYVVLRGRVVESCQSANYTQVRDIGSIISPHHIMLHSSIYVTQNISEALVEVLAIKVETMIKLVQQSTYMQQLLWTDSLYALTRFYYAQMKPLGQLEQSVISQLLVHMKFQKFNRGDQVYFQGAILLNGKVEARVPLSPVKSASRSIIPGQVSCALDPVLEQCIEDEDYVTDSVPKGEIINGPHLFSFKEEGYTFSALTQIHTFLFDSAHNDDIRRTMIEGLSLSSEIKQKQQSNFNERHFSTGSGINRSSFGFKYLKRISRATVQRISSSLNIGQHQAGVSVSLNE